MEKNEKTQNVPAWVKIIQDFPEACQQSIGNMCAGTIQNLCLIALFSYPLFAAICREAVANCSPVIDADRFVEDIVNDAFKSHDEDISNQG